MKHKSKLSLFATAVLNALLLIVPVSAFATVEAGQEIGVPQAMEIQPKGCFGVVLSPDGDGFYSVRDGLLTHYQIDPFKKIGSIAIDLAQLKDRLAKEQCEVLITNNGSKLILVYREWIVVLDRSMGKLTNMLERKGELKSGDSGASTLNENELVILSQFMEGPEESLRVWFKLTVLDVNTLRLKRPVMDIQGKFEFGYASCCTGIQITKIQDRLYLSSGSTLAVLNNKTYEPELTLITPRLRSFWPWLMVSKDYQKLYAVPVRFVNDYLTQTEKDYGEPKEGIRDNFVLIFDQATRQSIREPTDRKKEGERRWRRDLYDPFMFLRNPTRNKRYVAGTRRYEAVIANRNASIDYYFYPYESGEAILKEVQLPDRKASYRLTSGARQYLMMKTSAGKVVPINDATFAKYHATDVR